MRKTAFCTLLVIAIGFMFGHSTEALAQPSEIASRIAAAVPSKPFAEPNQPRKLLVFTLTRGFRHESIAAGVQAFRALGEKTGAFEIVHSEDPAVFEPQRLIQFDAVCMLNTTGELFTPSNLEELDPAARASANRSTRRWKQSLLDFVAGGGGLIGIHAATDSFYKWLEYGELMGGYFNGHPWHEEVTVIVEEPDHPLCASFGASSFQVTDEIYLFRSPYSRLRQRVLLSLDADRTDLRRSGIRRSDQDFAVSWVRTYGSGRVFYCSLGHREEIYWNPDVLRHYLAGIQFVMGDLVADATPSIRRSAGGESLIDGQTLAGWQGLVGNVKTRGAMSPEQLAAAQVVADQQMAEHWTVTDGVIRFDGAGQSITTVEDYGDIELRLDWKIDAGGDSGIYLRGTPQVQIWDPAQGPEGSGGLYNNLNNPSKPSVRADQPVGFWNNFQMTLMGERVSVRLNDVLVVDNVILENYWDRSAGLYPTGPIELQAHGGPIEFKNIFVKSIAAKRAAAAEARSTWQPLLNGKDLTGWTCKEGSWTVENGVLARRGGGDIWTEAQFGNFRLELEFKLAAGTNSGLFFRTGDIRDCVQTGIELQVFDSYGKEVAGKHDCGAIYDCLAPTVNAVRKPGEWNHLVLTCMGPVIQATMNGRRIIDMNLDDWTEPRLNPDGTKNKFSTAYKDMPRSGHIGFQDHGKPIEYRNIRIEKF